QPEKEEKAKAQPEKEEKAETAESEKKQKKKEDSGNIVNEEETAQPEETSTEVTAATEGTTVRKTEQEETSEEEKVSEEKTTEILPQYKTSVESTNLNEFVISAKVDGARDENGKLILHIGSTYSFRVEFQESQNNPFNKRGELIYEIPSQLIPERLQTEKENGTFDLKIRVKGKTYIISGNTYRLEGNKIFVKFNEEHQYFFYLEMVENVKFYLEFTAVITESAEKEDMNFGTSLEQQLEFSKDASVSIEKKGEYKKEEGKFVYTVEVVSTGTSRDVTVKDTITGTLLTYDKNVTAESSIKDKAVDGKVTKEGEKGFSYLIPFMNDGETVTLTYSATVDYSKLPEGENTFTPEQIGNAAEVSGSNNTGQATWGEDIETIEAYEENITKEGILSGEIKDGKSLIDWSIVVNQDAKVPVGKDSTVTDTLIGNGIPIRYSGEGLTVTKYDASGKEVSKEKVPWESLQQYDQNTSWQYVVPPETDGIPHKYVITYQTEVDVAGIVGEDGVIIGNKGQFKDLPDKTYEIKIKSSTENTFTVSKYHTFHSTNRADWVVDIELPKCGFKDTFKVQDELPAVWGTDKYYQEEYKENSLEMVLDGKTIPEDQYSLIPGGGERNKPYSFEVVFDLTREEVKKLFAESNQERTLTLRYSTVPQSGWPPAIHHINKVTVLGDQTKITAEDSYKNGIPNIRKESTGKKTINGLPAFRFGIYLDNVKDSQVEVEDEFDRDLFEVVEVGEQAGGARSDGGAKGNKEGGTVTYDKERHTFTLKASKAKGGVYHLVYYFSYYLKVKDREALKILNQRMANSLDHQVIVYNKATWVDIGKSGEASAIYSYNPLLKTIEEEPAESNQYTVKYSVEINPEKVKLNDGKPFEVTDTMQSHMNLVTDSLDIKLIEDNGEKDYSCEDAAYKYDENNKSFTLMVPDEKHIKLTYQVQITGEGAYKNDVKLSPGYEVSAEKDSIDIESQGGGQGVEIAVRVIKRDNDTQETLAGAKFKLYKKAKNEEEPEVIQEKNEDVIFTTDENGSVTLVGGKDKKWHLNPGDEFWLEEIAAPEGYKLPGKKFGPYTIGDISSEERPAGFCINGSTINLYNEKKNVRGNKIWDDKDNQDGVRPESITVRLMKTVDGKKTEAGVPDQVVTAKDGWRWEFPDLAEYENGKEITYSVEEVDVPVGYEASYPEGTYNIVNTHVPETIDIDGKKIWDDGNDRDKIRRNSVTVDLYRTIDENGNHSVDEEEQSEIVKSFVVTEKEDWSWHFTDLPKKDGGKEILYTVKERGVPAGYEASYPEGTYDIVNTHRPETIDIRGRKIWEDGDNSSGRRPKTITIHLLENGTVKDTKTVSEAENWSWDFGNLPRRKDGQLIEYTIQEEKVEGYLTEYVKNEGGSYDIKNTLSTRISGSKVWNDADNRDGTRPESITVQLMKKVDGNETETGVPDQVVTAKDDWNWAFENLPKYEVKEDGKTQEIVYSVKEKFVEDGYYVEYQEDEKGVFYIINNKSVDISGEKTWKGVDEQTKLPESITIHLWNGDKEVNKKEVTAKDEWKWTFKGLPKYENGALIAYTISEDAVDNYSQEICGYDVTNTYTPGKVSVSGSKTWKDEDNRDGIRPKSITVRLMKTVDGKKTEAGVPDQTVTAEGKWSWKFADLPEYENEKKITYSVEEIDVAAGYEASYPEGTNNIVNTHRLETINISGKKTWEDADNRSGRRPKAITIRLLKNGTVVDTRTVSEAENWSWSFEGLPKYEQGKVGVEIAYSIAEDPVPGYRSEVSGYNVTNRITSVAVRKVDIADETPLAGAHLQILDTNGTIVADWLSSADDFVMEGLQVETTYILREVGAPEGYSLAKDTVFRLSKDGTIDKENTGAVHKDGVLLVEDKRTQTESTSATVVKRVSYNGLALVAKDVSFYVALYYDKECTKLAVPQKEVRLQNVSSAEVTFDNLEVGRTYYAGECDKDGNLIYVGELAGGAVYQAKFTGTNGNTIVTSEGNNVRIELDNQLDQMPDGFYIEGQLHVTKKLLDKDGRSMDADKVFYAGIFDDPEHTKLSTHVGQNILELNLAGTSQAENKTSVTLLNMDAKVTLYVAEVDETGMSVAGASDFAYEVSVEGEKAVLTPESSEAYVTIINRRKAKEKEEEKSWEEEEKDSSRRNVGHKTKNTPGTGDRTPVVPMAVTLIVSLLVAMYLLYENRKRQK
ncbi:MAG: Cna B-type domain-containing protein, partial [Eubacteriales bacterium]|nr:Cna B-type domain-containing protein [Eubacteriales bacterium]